MKKGRHRFAAIVLASAALAANAWTPARLLAAGVGQEPAGRSTPRSGGVALPPDAAPRVRATVSRAAMWLGEPVTYTVEITCPAGTDIVADDLPTDRLGLSGLELLDAGVDRDVQADGGIVYRAHYRVASYSVETPPRIEALSVRYRTTRSGSGAQNLQAAQEVEVPPLELAVRSLLPDKGIPSLRDARPIRTLPRGVAFLGPLAIGALVLSAAPVLLGMAAVLARLRAASRRPSKRRAQARQRDAFEEIRRLAAAGDESARLDAFDRLDGLVRDYLSERGMNGRALTADEIEARLGQTVSAASSSDLASVIRACGRARYGGAALAGAEELERAVARTGRLFGEPGFGNDTAAS